MGALRGFVIIVEILKRLSFWVEGETASRCSRSSRPRESAPGTPLIPMTPKSKAERSRICRKARAWNERIGELSTPSTVGKTSSR